MKAILELLGTFVFDGIFRLVEIYFLKAYIDLVHHLRSIFFTWVWTFVCLILFFSGFIFCHIGLFLFLPLSPFGKALFILILGIVYILIAIISILRLHTRERWYEISGIKQLKNKHARSKKK